MTIFRNFQILAGSITNNTGRVYAQDEQICIFLENKEKENLLFQDPSWFSRLSFLMDKTAHINNLNLELKAMKKLVLEML